MAGERVGGKPTRAAKANDGPLCGHITPLARGRQSAMSDPKDGDLYVTRMKPGETLVEVRRRPDLRIGAQSCVKGRKTHRTV